MDEATFNALVTEGTEKHYDVNARQVSNGFALAGNVRYVKHGNVVSRQRRKRLPRPRRRRRNRLNNVPYYRRVQVSHNMPRCHIDFETRSLADLLKVGADAYAQHWSTSRLCWRTM
jgi:hypothetical protein